MKGVYRIAKTLASGERVTLPLLRQVRPRFWTGRASDDESTPGYLEAYDAVANPTPAQKAPLDEASASVSEMIEAWRRSREWTALAPRTQKHYDQGLKDILSEFGGIQATVF